MLTHANVTTRSLSCTQIGFIWMTYFFNPFLLNFHVIANIKKKPICINDIITALSLFCLYCAFILERYNKRKRDRNVEKVIIKDPVLSILHYG